MSEQIEHKSYRNLAAPKVIDLEEATQYLARKLDMQGKIEAACSADLEALIAEKVKRQLGVLQMQFVVRDAVSNASQVDGERVIPDTEAIEKSFEKLPKIAGISDEMMQGMKDEFALRLKLADKDDAARIGMIVTRFIMAPILLGSGSALFLASNPG